MHITWQMTLALRASLSMDQCVCMYSMQWHQETWVSVLIPGVLSDVSRPEGLPFQQGIQPAIRHLSLPLKSAFTSSLTHTRPVQRCNIANWGSDLIRLFSHFPFLKCVESHALVSVGHVFLAMCNTDKMQHHIFWTYNYVTVSDEHNI